MRLTRGLLAFATVGGLGATVYLTVQATRRFDHAVECAEWDHDGPLTLKEKLDIGWREFVPPAISVAAVVGLVAAGHYAGTRDIRAVMHALRITTDDFDALRKAAKGVVSPKKWEEIREKAVEVKGQEPYIGLAYPTGKGEHLFYEEYSGRYFKSDIESVRKACNDFNAYVINHNYASLNHLYSLLGIPAIGIGDDLGWTTDQLLEPIFSSKIAEDQSPCLVLSQENAPVPFYWRAH